MIAFTSYQSFCIWFKINIMGTGGEDTLNENGKF